MLKLLRKAEINELNMSILVQQYIFGLQIAVNYVPFMKLLDSNQNFSQIEDRVLHGQTHLFFYLLEELTAR